MLGNEPQTRGLHLQGDADGHPAGGRTDEGTSTWQADDGVTDAAARESLKSFVDQRLARSGGRPTTGTEVEVAFEDWECERVRTALRRLAARTDSETLALAATGLEVSLEDLLAFLNGCDGAATVEFDAGDCAVMGLALFRAGSANDDHRKIGRRLYRRLRTEAPAVLDADDPSAR